MYKNYLLRNISPLDPEYDLSDLINDFYEMVKKSLTKVEEELGAALYEKMILHRKLDAAIEIAITCATDAWCGTEEELRASILEDIEKEINND